MSKKLIPLALVTLLSLVAFSLWADSAGQPAQEATGTSFDSAQIDALLAMPAAERKAALQKLSPEERRSLWMNLRQARAQQNGKQLNRGSYKSGDLTKTLDKPINRPAADKAVGTITYDDGVGTNTFGGGAIIGNRFNTHDGGITVTTSGMVTEVVAVVQQGPAFSSTSAGFVLLGPQTTGGGAFAIFSTFTGAITGMTDTLTFTGIGANYTGNSFFVLFGDFASIYVPVFGTGSTNGQGHHGVVGYTGGMGPNITGTFDFGGALNALIRASGNILPVELMSFDAE
jgi:hypothetical protein